MQKPEGYDQTQAQQAGGDFPKLPAGGYVLGVVSAEETRSKNGNAMIHLRLDVAEGEHRRFYTKLSEKLEKEIYLDFYQLTDGASLPFFKGMVETFEKSNVGFKFNFDERTLVNKKVGANIREEEYEKNGEVKTSLKIAFLLTIDEVKKGVEVLPKKTLAGKSITPIAPTEQEKPKDDDLPF
jgi:hypothetical protein